MDGKLKANGQIWLLMLEIYRRMENLWAGWTTQIVSQNRKTQGQERWLRALAAALPED